MKEKLSGRRKSLKQKIQAGDIRRKEVVRRLAELAYGRANDCVKLVWGQPGRLEELDLTMLSEIRLNAKGEVEVRLIDRLKVLEQLAAMVEEDGSGIEELLLGSREGEAR